MEPYQKYEDTFCIMQQHFSPKVEKHYEGIFTQGSGYLHLRGSYEEGISGADQNEEYMRFPANVTLEKSRSPVSKWGTYLPGVTGKHPLLKEEMVNLPYLAAFHVEVQGAALDMGTCKILSYKRWLDMRDGVLYRFFDWEAADGVRIRASYRRFVSAERKNLLVQEMEFEALRGTCILKMYQDIDEKVKTNGYEHCIKKSKAFSGNAVELTVETDTGDKIGMLSRAYCDGEEFKSSGENCVFEKILKQGEKVQVRKLAGVLNFADADTENPMELQRAQVLYGIEDWETLYREHRHIWDRRWEKSQVLIEGNEEDQKRINFAVYHLLRCGNPDSARAAVCAKGFSGEAYFGHFFWDTEIYMLPFYIHTNPETAKRLAEFRVNTLPGARMNAEAFGCQGARYPWESSVSGEEQCPNWQYADHEIHVTADVVFGMWHVWKATHDEAFLKECLPAFLETARYWMGRVEKKQDGTVHVKGVMGPDEYVCLCDNNAYTNEMIAKSLEYTVQAVSWARNNAPNFWHDLRVCEEELAEFERCAKALKILGKQTGLIMQCDNFQALEEPDFQKQWKDRKRPYGQFVSQERNYRTKALKQADVLMLPFLFPKEMNREQVQENYRYYEPYTTHDSSLSAVVHGIVCAQMGDTEEAYRYFKKASGIDFDETQTGAAQGVHIANCGGIWQAVVYGFAGMSRCYEEPEITLTPRLPKAWKSISFCVCYGGKDYRVKIAHK